MIHLHRSQGLLRNANAYKYTEGAISYANAKQFLFRLVACQWKTYLFEASYQKLRADVCFCVCGVFVCDPNSAKESFTAKKGQCAKSSRRGEGILKQRRHNDPLTYGIGAKKRKLLDTNDEMFGCEVL